MTSDVLTSLVSLLIFPGLVFTAVVGMLATWVDRKVTARIQWRVGPPLLQPFYDFFKLLGKEVIVPRAASKFVFLAAPLIGLAGATLAATLLGTAALNRSGGFTGDLIVLVYLLVIPSLAIILGAGASANPYASVGASREIKLVLGYELPFIISVLAAVVKSGGQLTMTGLLAYQYQHGSFAWSVSGFLALVVAILCMQAKLALVPFDQAEAETEIMSGVFVEYSGAPLGVFKLTRAMMYVVMPLFLIVTLWGGFGTSAGSALLGVVKYVVLLVVIILIRNTNPRVKIEHAVKFFWGPVTLLAALAIILAFAGV